METVLDPFSTAVSIGLLSFMPENTKLTIYNNSIYYREPGILQPVLRWYNGESCDDIKKIQEPLRYWFKWLMVHKNAHKHKKFLQLLSQGLEILCKYYNENHEIKTILQSCKDIAGKLYKGVDVSSFSFFITNEPSMLYVGITSELWGDEDFHFMGQHLLFLENSSAQNHNIYKGLIMSNLEEKKQKFVSNIMKYKQT